jgi:hypothetical protein
MYCSDKGLITIIMNRAKVAAVYVKISHATLAVIVDGGIGRQTKTDTLQVQKQGDGKPIIRPDLHRVVTQPEGISLTDGNYQSRPTPRRTEKAWNA